MCLCLIALRSNDYQHENEDEFDSELHYSFHNWEPKVLQFSFIFMYLMQI